MKSKFLFVLALLLLVMADVSHAGGRCGRWGGGGYGAVDADGADRVGGRLGRLGLGPSFGSVCCSSSCISNRAWSNRRRFTRPTPHSLYRAQARLARQAIIRADRWYFGRMTSAPSGAIK